MKVHAALLTLLVIGLVTEHVDAGWKFWKSKKKDEETTTTTTTTPSTVIVNPTPAPGGKPASTSINSNTNKALAGAADPGLAIGVGNTGGNIRGDAQPTRPGRPNPGTEVGLDISKPKPSNPALGGTSGSGGYRDWAADLTGAGDRRSPPKLPAQGPALSPGGRQPAAGSGSTTSTASSTPQGKPQVQPTPQPQPGRQPSIGQVQPGQVQPSSPNTTPKPSTAANDGKPQLSTLNIGNLNPGSRPGSPGSPTPSTRPGSPSSPTGSISSSGGKSWADIAAGGSRPGSPTPSPRPAQGVQPAPGGQTGSRGQPTSTTSQPTRTSQIPVQPYGQPGHQGSQRPGQSGVAAAGAAAAAGAVAGATASGITYTSNPTYSKGNKITNEDLKKLSEALYIKDTNNAFKHITVNMQSRTSQSNSNDQAPQPLLTVKPEALQISTVQKVIALFDNYELDTKTNEYVSPAERQEESLLVDTLLSTNVMSAAMRFLADKGIVRQDYYEYKDLLRRIWFSVYSRGEGKIGSSGFEHVFLAETRSGNDLLGLHNWIYFNHAEKKGLIDYLGWIKKLDLGTKGAIVKARIKFSGIEKPSTSMFVGTSPELEMALYTVCFYARPDAACPVSLGGAEFDIMTYKYRYRGKDLIGAAYPTL